MNIHDNHKQVAREFPDFDLATLPHIPDGFESTAWHNESCPTWHEGDSTSSPKQGDLMLAIDYADDARRECPGGERFNLHMYDGAGSPEYIFGSDDWAAIETAVAYVRYVRHLGLGFHVDTRGPDYVMDHDGARVFSDDEAAEYDRVVYEAHGIADPFELAFTVWRIMGLTS